MGREASEEARRDCHRIWEGLVGLLPLRKRDFLLIA